MNIYFEFYVFLDDEYLKIFTFFGKRYKNNKSTITSSKVDGFLKINPEWICVTKCQILTSIKTTSEMKTD